MLENQEFRNQVMSILEVSPFPRNANFFQLPRPPIDNAPSTVKVPSAPEVVQEPSMLKCSICLDLASAVTQLVATVCGHMFCEPCIVTALASAKK